MICFFLAAVLVFPVIPASASSDKRQKKVALTFDDGPHPRITRQILDYLDKEDIKATFFIIGCNAEQWPEIVKEEIVRGHEIGNHTYSHDEKKRGSASQMHDDLAHTDNILRGSFGYETVLFRPPQGVCNDNVISAASDFEYKIVLWDVDTHDWAHASTESIVSNVKRNVSDGDIILFHDYISGESHTLDSLKIIIPYLKDEGYTFVTVSDLICDKTY